MKELSIPMLVAQVTRTLLDNTELRRATYYADPKLVISICRRHRFSKRNRLNDYVVKVGQPNYLELAAIKRMKKDGVTFPVNLVVTKAWPKKRKA